MISSLLVIMIQVVIHIASTSSAPTHNETQNVSITPLSRITIFPTNTPTIEPTATLVPTQKPTSVPSNSLLTAINTYRHDQNIPSLTVHPMLCRIASERIEQLIKKGSLDQHEGIHEFTQEIQSMFNSWHEVIYKTTQQQTTTDVVRQGWANSSLHNQSILNTDSQYGCGKQKNGYAVFLLTGKSKL